jgi:hypothetical protein
MVVVEGYDVRAGWSQWRSGELRPADLWRSWRGVDERAWFAADDVVPAAVGLARAAGRAVRPAPRPWRTTPPTYRPGRAARRR